MGLCSFSGPIILRILSITVNFPIFFNFVRFVLRTPSNIVGVPGIKTRKFLFGSRRRRPPCLFLNSGF